MDINETCVRKIYSGISGFLAHMSKRDEVEGKMNIRFHLTAKIIGSTG
jgi:hypothetical protein